MATKFPPHKKAFDVTASNLYRDKLENEDSYDYFVEKLLNLPILDDYASGSSPPIMNTLSSISSKTFQEMLSRLRFPSNESTDFDDTKALQERITEKCKDIKKQILETHQAIKTEFKSSGHWYECPNGHPCMIEDYDGAMQMNKCPDCNEQIDGESHQLTE
ncbi:unnamed protein product [Rhizophagus irregularis]|nr:unnamed protein product [Rhizophagus irregularis]